MSSSTHSSSNSLLQKLDQGNRPAWRLVRRSAGEVQEKIANFYAHAVAGIDYFMVAERQAAGITTVDEAKKERRMVESRLERQTDDNWARKQNIRRRFGSLYN